MEFSSWSTSWFGESSKSKFKSCTILLYNEIITVHHSIRDINLHCLNISGLCSMLVVWKSHIYKSYDLIFRNKILDSQFITEISLIKYQCHLILVSIQSRDNSIKGYEYTTDNAITSERMVMMSSNVYSSSVKSSIIHNFIDEEKNYSDLSVSIKASISWAESCEFDKSIWIFFLIDYRLSAWRER